MDAIYSRNKKPPTDNDSIFNPEVDQNSQMKPLTPGSSKK